MFGELNLTSLGQRCQWKLHHLRRSNTPPENQNTKSNLQKTMVTKQAKSIYFFWGGRPSFPWWLKDTLSFRKHGPFFEVVGAEVLLWRFGHAKCTFPAAWLKTWRKKAPPTRFGDVWGKYDPVILGVSENRGKPAKWMVSNGKPS